MPTETHLNIFSVIFNIFNYVSTLMSLTRKIRKNALKSTFTKDNFLLDSKLLRYFSKLQKEIFYFIQ